jgi:predicted Holliday junction resolvase-like endonuclease
MKKVMAVIALVVAVAFVGVTLVEAAQCPLLIKQLKDGVAKVSDTKKKADVEKMIAEAEKLHADGKHAESVKKAEEAAKLGGIKLEMKKM